MKNYGLRFGLFWMLLAFLAGQNVWAYDFMVDGLCYNRNSDGTSVAVTYQTSGIPRYASLSGAISIPANVSYGDYTYSVTSIGYSAFYGCSGLTSVTIPASVTSIGASAFSGCSGLTSIKVESGNQKYDSRDNCNAIIESATNTLIAGCKNTLIPNSVTFIGASAFWGCSGLTSLTIPNSVTSIGDEAFYGCKGLMSLTIPNSVTKIGGSAFKGCTGLMSVIIGNVVTTISSEAFSDCSSLTSVTIPNSVTSIGKYAFQNCSGLTSLTIPNSVTSIGDYAFFDCSGLTSVTIPNSVTSIGYSAFYGCSGLTSVTIPASVTSIGASAFSGCSGLTSIKVESGNQKYDSRDNCNAIIESATNTLIAGCKNTLIPNSVTSIGASAFRGCSGLMSLTIPNSVTSIGDHAFRGCSGLMSLTIPNSVTSIGNCAFEECSGLTSVTIPNSVTSIGWYVFYGCSGLTSVSIGNSVTSIGDAAFYECSGLTSVTIPNSVTSIGRYAFYGCSGLTSVVWNAKSCADFTSTASSQPFNGLTGIISFNFGDQVEKIPAYLCYGLKGLTSVTIPNSITSIGNYAFSGTNLTVVILSGIGDVKFGSSVPRAATLVIKDGITSIKGLSVSPSQIYCYGSTPPVCDANTFISYSGTLHVPATALSAYFTADYWVNFGKIQGDAVVPEAVTLSKATAQLELGGKLTLQATVSPANAVPNSVVWRSTNTSVATVNSSGVVTAGKAGECDIVAFCLDRQAECHVTVNNTQIIITLDRHEATIEPNEMIEINASSSPVSVQGVVTSSRPDVAAARLNGSKIQVVGIKPGVSVIKLGSADGKARPDSCIVTVSGIVPGDANGDGSVNVSDYVTVANYILEEDPQPFVFAAADIDGNEDINVSDLVAVANIALTYEGAPRRLPRPSGAAAELAVAATLAHHAGSHQLMLGLPEDVALAALQMDINLPQGMTVAAARLTGGTSHTVNVERLSAGGYRVLVSSPSNLPIAGEISLTLDGAQPGEVVINHIMLAEPDATLHHAADMTLPLEGAVTGVDDLDNTARIYAKDGKVVIDATAAGMAGFVLPSGASRMVPVQAGHNEFDGFAQGVVIVKFGHEVKKLIL